MPGKHRPAQPVLTREQSAPSCAPAPPDGSGRPVVVPQQTTRALAAVDFAISLPPTRPAPAAGCPRPGDCALGVVVGDVMLDQHSEPPAGPYPASRACRPRQAACVPTACLWQPAAGFGQPTCRRRGSAEFGRCRTTTAAKLTALPSNSAAATRRSRPGAPVVRRGVLPGRQGPNVPGPVQRLCLSTEGDNVARRHRNAHGKPGRDRPRPGVADHRV